MKRSVLIALASAFVFSGAALAHVTLEVKQAAAGSSYKAVLRVPHGCAGASTVRLTVKVPEGFIGVKPMPHAGWTVEVVKGKYAKPHDFYGSKLDEGATEITWKGGPLPDAYYDEFVMAGMIAPDVEPGTMYFLAVQECDKGVNRWIEIPEAGKGLEDYEFPAASLKILPKP